MSLVLKVTILQITGDPNIDNLFTSIAYSLDELRKIAHKLTVAWQIVVRDAKDMFFTTLKFK